MLSAFVLVSSQFLLRPDVYIVFGALTVLYVVGVLTNKLPSTGAVHDLVAMIDSKGGNILILLFLAMYFFHRTEQMYYVVIDLVNIGKIASDNGVALNGLLFCTGAFGTVMGALIKVMGTSVDGTKPTTTSTS